MPRIPVIPEQVAAQGGFVRPPQAQADVGAAAIVPRALGQLAQAGTGLALELVRQDQEATAVTWTADQISRARADWTQRFHQARTAAQPGAPDFTAGLLAPIDEELRTRLAEAPNPLAQRLAFSRLSSLRDSLHEQAFTFEMGQRQAHRIGQLDELVTRNAATLRADPTQVTAILADTIGAIDASELPPDVRQRRRQEAQGLLLGSWGYGLVDRNPAGAREAFLRGELAGRLPPELRERLLSHADTLERRGRGEARARIAEGYRIDLEAAAAGVERPFTVSDAQIRQAYADNPLEAERLIETRNVARRASTIDRNLIGTTPEERRGMVDGARSDVAQPRAAAPAAGGGQPAPDAFETAHMHRESRNIPTLVNDEGFAGLYQFGAPALNALRMYTPGTGESLRSWNGEGNRAARWSGTFRIPGHPEVRTLQDFLNNPAAQRTAYLAHVDLIDRELAPELARYDGQTVGGVPVTRSSLRAMALLGGITGTRRFLESGGTYNPADSNMTSLRADGIRFAGYDSQPVGGVAAGIGARAAHADLVASRVQAYETRLLQHPAEAAMQQPQVAQAFQAAQQDPALLPAAIAASLDWQRHAGVPEEALRPLPQATAQVYAQRFDQAQTPRERLALLQAITGHAGPVAADPAIRDRVLAQVRAAGGSARHKIPEVASYILELADSPDRRAVAERLLSELATPLRDLNDVPAADRQTLASAVDDAWSYRPTSAVGQVMFNPAMGGVLLRQAQVTGNAAYAERSAQLRTAIEHVARLRAAGSTDYAEAARSAALDLTGERAMLADDRHAVHFPAWLAPAGRMRDGFDALRRRVDILMEPQRPPDDQRLAQQQFDRIVRDARERGVWVNDGDGYALVVPGTGSVLAIDGQPWRVSAHDVATAGRPPQAAAEPLP